MVRKGDHGGGRPGGQLEPSVLLAGSLGEKLVLGLKWGSASPRQRHWTGVPISLLASELSKGGAWVSVSLPLG